MAYNASIFDEIQTQQQIERLRIKFYDNVLIEPFSTCWIWTSHKTTKGYGRLYFKKIDKRSIFISAHRFSYYLHFKIDPREWFVCHKCDNPSCVNPEHLYLGNAAMNVRDCILKERNDGGGKKKRILMSKKCPSS